MRLNYVPAWALVTAAVLLLPHAPAQSPQAAPEEQKPSEFVVRITVNLVQVDATVTDNKGKPVTDLRPEDFAVLQDGVPQKITNFSYVTGEKSSRLRPASRLPNAMPAPVLPARVLQPEEVHRVVALVVDDLGLSFESIAFVRNALKKFVDQQMQPGDLVAIIRTSAGMGALQQFTNDKRRLDAAIDQVKYRFRSRVTLRSFSPVLGGSSPRRLPGAPSQLSSDVPGVAGLDLCQAEAVTTVGSLGAIRFVVDGLRDLPGRKALILFSEAMRMFDLSGKCDYNLILENFRKLTDATERAGVVIYTIDPRGVQVLVPSASDFPMHLAADPWALPPDPTTRLAEASGTVRTAYFGAQQGLEYLAEETGGLFARHNDIAGALRDAVDDSGSYYLIGYHPPARTFDPKSKEPKFHRITVRVKRPGLRVRSRNGFFGIPGDAPGTPPRNAAEEIARAAASPFAVNDIRVRLTALFSEAAPPLITGLLYIDPQDLSFTNSPEGNFLGALQATAFTYDGDGQIVSSSQRSYQISFEPRLYELVRKNSFVLKIQHPARAGAYQLHVVVRDEGSGKIGTASQFIEVPDLKRGGLALSGIVLKQVLALDATPQASVGGSRLLRRDDQGWSDLSDVQNPAEDAEGNEAVRVFKTGAGIQWRYEVFNARKDNGGRPSVTAQVHLFRETQEIYRNDPASLQWPARNQGKALKVAGQMQLPPSFGPGNYVLQVVVTDGQGRKKPRIASQWIDFAVKE